MKMKASEFREKFLKAGAKTVKGRPFIPEDVFGPDTTNRKVRNARKVYDEKGNVLADSKWEYTVLKMLETARLAFEKQRKFELIPTTRPIKNIGKTLSKRSWKPDFCFEKEKIVADAKGHTTEMARIKIQLFLHLYPGWDIWILKNKEDVFELIHHLKKT